MKENKKELTEEEKLKERERLCHMGQYLCFSLCGEEYGVEILRVQEIRCWEPVSRVPNVPVHEKGVINLRGAIIPIIDLGERFNLGAAKLTDLTAVIILQVNDNGRKRVVGAVVDTVSDVIDVDKRTIQPSPDFGSKVSTEYISGLADLNGTMLTLLDVDSFLSLEASGECEKEQNLA